MSTISVTLPIMAHQSLAKKASAQDGNVGFDLQTDAPTSQDDQSPQTAKFDFRHMSSDELLSAMPQIVSAAHLTPEEQIDLHGGFVRDALNKVNPDSPDTSSQDQDILAGLLVYRDGDLSRGDTEGATSFSKLWSELSAMQK